MKRTLSFLVVLLTTLSSWAISPDVFNHLGAGVGVGTTGITFELATPITSFVQMRAGVSYMPASSSMSTATSNTTYPTPPDSW